MSLLDFMRGASRARRGGGWTDRPRPNAPTATAPVYIGRLYALRLRSGRELDLAELGVPEVVLGIVPGIGFATAPDRASLDAGRYLAPSEQAPWWRVSAVLYERYRPEWGPGSDWMHDLKNTEAQLGPGGVCFRHPEAPKSPYVCPFPRGDFICGG